MVRAETRRRRQSRGGGIDGQVSSKNLVIGKKYKLVVLQDGVEYPQANDVFRGRNGDNLIWEHTSTNGKVEQKKFPEQDFIYKNVPKGKTNGGTRRRRR